MVTGSMRNRMWGQGIEAPRGADDGRCLRRYGEVGDSQPGVSLGYPPPPGFFISVHGSVDIPDTVLISRVDKKRLTVFSDGAGGTMAEVFEIARATIPQIWTFVNSKLKCKRMWKLEGRN